MPVYTCSKCSKIYTNKADFNRHNNRKTDCIGRSLEELVKEKVEEKLEQIIIPAPDDNNAIILNLVNFMHNKIYSVNPNALDNSYHDIIRILFLGFMQSKLDNDLKSLKDPAYYVKVDDFDIEYLEYLHLDKLLTLSLTHGDFERYMKIVWKDILYNHPLTSKVFDISDFFKIEPILLFEFLDKVNTTLKKVEFDKLSDDVKGQIYEYFINQYQKSKGTGKALGQYFTPRTIINNIMRLNQDLFEERKTCSIYDPCMGSAGFLTEAYRFVKNKQNYLIEPSNVCGGEFNPDTYITGLMNILLTTGHIGNITCGDSLKNNTNIKYDWIITNPPFGTKQDYKQLLANPKIPIMPKKRNSTEPTEYINMSDMYPVKADNGSCLFVYHCMAKLNTNGICNIVLPNGELTTSNRFTHMRKKLVEDFNLKAVMNVAKGEFNYTGVETVILFFEKKDKTSVVKFYKMSGLNVELEGEVNYNDIVSKKYNLQYQYYKTTDIIKNHQYEYKSLGDILINIKGVKYKVSDGQDLPTDEYKYPLIRSSKDNKVNYLKEYTFKGPYLVVGTGGSANFGIYEYFNLSSHSNAYNVAESFLLKYVCYYLESIKESVNNECFTGSGLKNLNTELFNQIKIPVHSNQKQQEIIDQYEFINKQIENYQFIKNNEKRLLNIISNNLQYNIMRDDQYKSLGNILIKVQGKKYDVSDGQDSLTDEYKYPLIRSSKDNKVKYLKTYTFKGPYLVIGTGGSANFGIYEYFNVTNDTKAFTVDEIFLLRYVYYYLEIIKEKINNECFHGSGLKHLKMDLFEQIKIPVCSIQKQQEIIDQYEQNQMRVAKLLNNINEKIDILTNIQQDLFK